MSGTKPISKSYFGAFRQSLRPLLHGLALTWRHFWQARQSRTPIGVANKNYFDQKTGIVTLQYPKQKLPVPDNARYQLHNEVDDCIVCDKCAKVCPVDCIDIEPIRSPEVFGTTSDGTAKRLYAAKFDIDMAKCCFCGLCTTVCPTECLTMTKDFDFSSFDVDQHTFEFADLSITDIAIKRKEWEAYQVQKAASKPTAPSGVASALDKRPTIKPKAVNRPVTKPAANPQDLARAIMERRKKNQLFDATSEGPAAKVEKPEQAKPVFRPKIKPMVTAVDEAEKKENLANAATANKPKPVKPVFRPKIKAVSAKADGNTIEPPVNDTKLRPIVKPNIKPVIKNKAKETSPESKGAKKPAKPRPTVKPKVVPRAPRQDEKSAEEKGQEEYLRPGGGGSEHEDQ